MVVLVRAAAFLFCLFVAGCASRAESIYINYRMVDDPGNNRIEFHYKNETRTSICLTPDQWPNSAGKINYGSDFLVLIVRNERFPVVDFNTGVCSGRCGERVSPGREIISYVSYADFRLPERFWHEPKTVEFRPQGIHC
jgi:hypothetical protein